MSMLLSWINLMRIYENINIIKEKIKGDIKYHMFDEFELHIIVNVNKTIFLFL